MTTQKVKEPAEDTMGQPPTPNFSAKDYSIFFSAGALSVDVVKTRIQIDPALKGNSLLTAGRKIVAAEGPQGLLTGQPSDTSSRAGSNLRVKKPECKKYLVELCGSRENDIKNRTAIYFGGAAIAEREFASGLTTGFTKLLATEGFSSLYAGFIPILAKQVPYPIGQFTVSERCTEFIYNRMTPEQRASLSHTANFMITLSSGIVADFAAAVLSQPADTLLSQFNKGHGPQGSMLYRLYALGQEAGVLGLFAGLGPRMIMTSGFVSSQLIRQDKGEV